MRIPYIIVAAIAIIVIGMTILRRDWVNQVFVASKAQKEISLAKEELRNAGSALEQAEKAVETVKIDLATKTETADKAREALKEAEEKLAALGASEEEIKEVSEGDKPDKLFVEVMKSQAQEILSGIALSGKAEAARKLEVRAETSGQVISEPIASGTKVKKDDVLCKLDPGTRQASFEQAQAALQTAQTQYNSTKRLSERKLASKTALQSAYAALEQAQSAVKQAEREISRLEIRAPFDGVLESQTAELGTLLQPGAACAAIIALDRVNLVGFAAESQVEKIKLGAHARGIVRNGGELPGKVTFVAATADPVTRTYRVEVNVPNKDQSIRDGSSVRINIALAGSTGHLVPQNALTLNAEGALGVRLHVNGIAEFHSATMVRDTPEGIWLTDLPNEIEVIVTGQEYAANGQPVEVSYREKGSE